MKDKKYAVRLTVKKQGYKTKSFKGIVLASSQNKAQEKAVKCLLEIIHTEEGLPFNESNVFVKQCTLWNDFVFAN